VGTQEENQQGKATKKWKRKKRRKIKVGEQTINIKKNYGHVS